MTIPAGITNISNYTFSNCSSLTSVTIPNGVTSIGDSAFYLCEGLTSVTIPNGVTSIGDYAFEGCKSLTSVTIPNSVTIIGDYAFEGCKSLTSVTIPDSVTSIGRNAFGATPWIESQQKDEYVVVNGTLIAYNGSGGAVTIPANVTSIGNGAFYWCTGLTSVTIPNSVTTIGERAFFECTGLTSVTIPNSVTTIGELAFSGCSGLTSVTIPASVTSIGKESFGHCDGLKAVNVASGNKNYCSVDGILFNAGKTQLLLYPNGKNDASSYTIPSTVTQIEYPAFGNRNLTSVTVPRSVKSIGGGAFSWCGSLQDITILNPSCTIARAKKVYINGVFNHVAENEAINKATTIHGYDGSTAQAYAEEIGNTFVNLGKAPMEIPQISKLTNTSSGVKITWGKVDGAAKYRVYYKKSGKWTKLTDVTGTSYTWKSAKVGTKYTFTVKAFDKNDKASDYDKTGKSITYYKLKTPAVPKVSNASTGVKISWTAVSGAAKYRIFYKTSGGKWTKIGDTAKTSYTWKKAKSGTKYSFTIRCVTKDGKSYTSDYNTTGKSITYVAAPKISKVSNTTTGVKITWGKVTGAGSYQVYYKTGGGKWTKIANTTKTSYTWTKAKSGTKYTFTVRCMDKTGEKYTSSYNNTGKSITYVAAPKIGKLSNTSSGVKITWGKVAGAAKYRVFYKIGNGKWTKAGDTAKTSYTWTKAKSGTTYSFTVRCVNKTGKSYTSAYDTKGLSIAYKK